MGTRGGMPLGREDAQAEGRVADGRRSTNDGDRERNPKAQPDCEF